jgi:hypothetical protein
MRTPEDEGECATLHFRGPDWRSSSPAGPSVHGTGNSQRNRRLDLIFWGLTAYEIKSFADWERQLRDLSAKRLRAKLSEDRLCGRPAKIVPGRDCQLDLFPQDRANGGGAEAVAFRGSFGWRVSCGGHCVSPCRGAGALESRSGFGRWGTKGREVGWGLVARRGGGVYWCVCVRGTRC